MTVWGEGLRRLLTKLSLINMCLMPLSPEGPKSCGWFNNCKFQKTLGMTALWFPSSWDHAEIFQNCLMKTKVLEMSSFKGPIPFLLPTFIKTLVLEQNFLCFRQTWNKPQTNLKAIRWPPNPPFWCRPLLPAFFPVEVATEDGRLLLYVLHQRDAVTYTSVLGVNKGWLKSPLGHETH